MSKINVNTWEPESGTAATLMASGDTVTVPSGAALTIASGATITNSGTATGFGGDNTPSFQARKTSVQSTIASDTYTKIGFETEDWDTASAYDHSTNYRFTVPTGEGGKYQFHAQFMWYANGGVGEMTGITVKFYVNGSGSNYSEYYDFRDNSNKGVNYWTPALSSVISLSAADYVEFYAKAMLASSTAHIDNNHGYFSGYKLIGV